MVRHAAEDFDIGREPAAHLAWTRYMSLVVHNGTALVDFPAAVDEDFLLWTECPNEVSAKERVNPRYRKRNYPKKSRCADRQGQERKDVV